MKEDKKKKKSEVFVNRPSHTFLNLLGSHKKKLGRPWLQPCSGNDFVLPDTITLVHISKVYEILYSNRTVAGLPGQKLIVHTKVISYYRIRVSSFIHQKKEIFIDIGIG